VSDSKKTVDLLKVAPGADAKRAEGKLDGTTSDEARVFPDAFAACGNVTMVSAVLKVPTED